MKLFSIFFRILFVVAAFLLGAFISVSLFIRFYGKTFVEDFFTAALDRKVEFSAIAYEFPRGMSIYTPRIAGIMQAKQISFQFDISEILSRRLTVDHLIVREPMLLTREGKERTLSVQNVSMPIRQSTKEGLVNTHKNFQILIRQVDVYNAKGKFYFNFLSQDRIVVADRIRISLQDVVVPVVAGPVPFQILVKLQAIKDLWPESSLRGAGWVDLLTKNLDGRVVAKESKGESWLESEITIKDKVVSVKGKLTKDNVFPQIQRLEGVNLGFLSSTELINNVVLQGHFQFQTQLDNFKVNDVLFDMKLDALPRS
ncbi:MAG: hypothetical protein HQL26_09320 [Candidatus Omnitrophica bacterium]|nr:hypothetical protein [Candidatus Omnitrophota bacterium]